MASHAFTERDGLQVVEVPTTDGQWLLVEQTVWGAIDPGSIIVDADHGIGQYIGVCCGAAVAAFLRDGGPARLVRSDFSVLRSRHPFCQGVIGLNRKSLAVDVGEQSDVLPGDMLKVDGKCARCVGTGIIGGQQGPLFETDDMMLWDLGVGAFSKEKLSEAELIARIAASGKRRMKRENGRVIEMSVNTSDFVHCPLLPLDRVLVGNKVAMVVGVCESQVYVQFEGVKWVQPLPEKYYLLLRRYGVPTWRTIDSQRKMTVHADGYRGMVFLPGDVIEQEMKTYRILGMVERRQFWVQEMATGEETVRYLTPCGFSAADILHRPSFFD
jgi:hypothetical protein